MMTFTFPGKVGVGEMHYLNQTCHIGDKGQTEDGIQLPFVED